MNVRIDHMLVRPPRQRLGAVHILSPLLQIQLGLGLGLGLGLAPTPPDPMQAGLGTHPSHGGAGAAAGRPGRSGEPGLALGLGIRDRG